MELVLTMDCATSLGPVPLAVAHVAQLATRYHSLLHPFTARLGELEQAQRLVQRWARLLVQPGREREREQEQVLAREQLVVLMVRQLVQLLVLGAMAKKE